MSTLSRRGPNANTPAKLPALETSRIADRNTQQAIDALREWVEVRLGSRGDRFERAVTFRDVDPLTARVAALEAAEATPTSGAAVVSSGSPDVTALSNRVATLEAYAPDKDAELAGQIASLQMGLMVANAQVQALQSQLALFSELTITEFLARQNEFTAAQTTRQVDVQLDEDEDGFFFASPDGAVSTTFYVRATADFTLRPPSPARVGATYTIVIQQDDIGGHAVTFDPEFDFGTAVVTLGTGSGVTTLIRAVAAQGFIGAADSVSFLTDYLTDFESLAADIRVTELGDTRVTETGERRVLKG